MKCIKHGEKIKRVENDQAFEMVHDKGWKYCPKTEWKEKVRDKT